MKTPESNTKLGKKLERGVQGLFRNGHGVIGLIIAAHHSGHAKHIGAAALEGVPIAHGKTQVIAHGFAEHLRFWVVMFERQGVLRVWTFIRYWFLDLRKICTHIASPMHRGYRGVNVMIMNQRAHPLDNTDNARLNASSLETAVKQPFTTRYYPTLQWGIHRNQNARLPGATV